MNEICEECLRNDRTHSSDACLSCRKIRKDITSEEHFGSNLNTAQITDTDKLLKVTIKKAE